MSPWGPEALGIGEIGIEVDEDRARNVPGFILPSAAAALIEVPAHVRHAHGGVGFGESRGQLVSLDQHESGSIACGGPLRPGCYPVARRGARSRARSPSAILAPA